MTARFARLRGISPRRELRFALLAAMETCWVYVALAFLATLLGARPISPVALFLAYWVAMLAGRQLPRIKERWIALQFAAIGIAVILLLGVVRAEMYQVALFDLTWIPRFFISIMVFSTEFLASLGVIYMYIRGLGFGTRPQTLWFIGFQFRLGIVAFFVIFGLSALTARFDPGNWVLVYFFVSLFAIALARMDESVAPIALGPRWAVTLLAAVTLVLFLGFGVIQVLTLDVVALGVQWLAIPASFIFGAIFFLLIIPFSLIADWLVEALRPLMMGLSQLNQILQNLMPQGAEETIRQMTAFGLPEQLAPILRGLGAVAAVVALGYLLARALNLRMLEIEQETYVREAIGSDDENAQVKEGRRAKKGAPHRSKGLVSAETIRRMYAALVASAGEAGLPRRPAETPYEFLPRLVSAFPSEAERIQTITEAYIAVHYGELVADSTQVRNVQRAWVQVRKSIKQK